MINRINEFVRHRLLGTNDFKMFVIISRPRSGSTWLVTLLNSHPNCITRGELFRHPTGSDAKSMYYRQFHRKWTRKVELVGFKIFYHHPLASDDKNVWELIAKDPTIKIVRLERRDKFRIYLSQQIGNKNNQWILRDKNERVKQKLHIDIDDLKYFLEENEQLEKLKHFTDLYKTHQVYEIYYEDLVAQTKEEINKLLGFLEVKEVTLHSELKKQNPEPIKELIENYSEIIDFLKSNGYSHLIR